MIYCPLWTRLGLSQAEKNRKTKLRMKWKWLAKSTEPCADEPLAYTSDEDEKTREGKNGLLPAVLRSRFQGEVPVDEWLVLYIFLEPHKLLTLECLLTR